MENLPTLRGTKKKKRSTEFCAMDFSIEEKSNVIFYSRYKWRSLCLACFTLHYLFFIFLKTLFKKKKIEEFCSKLDKLLHTSHPHSPSRSSFLSCTWNLRREGKTECERESNKLVHCTVIILIFLSLLM